MSSQKKYGDPAEVAKRMREYIGRYGRENTSTLLLYEGAKAIEALLAAAPAPVAAPASESETLDSIWQRLEPWQQRRTSPENIADVLNVIRATPPAASADGARDLELDMYRTFYGTLAPTEAVTDVLAERRRQVEAEGWTPEHDDVHAAGDMAEAAAAYAQEASAPCGGLPMGWPWAKEWWKPGTPRRMLVKAGALILAEIERIDRAALRAGKGDN